MKIYALLNEKANGVDTVCMSEDINDIWVSICENFTPNKGYAKLEIWENGKCTCNVRGDEIFRKIINEVQGPASKKNNTNISKFAYDLYKQQWIDTHDNIGFSKMIYACFDEFYNNEYQDKEYMISLLKDEVLINLYHEDIKG